MDAREAYLRLRIDPSDGRPDDEAARLVAAARLGGQLLTAADSYDLDDAIRHGLAQVEAGRITEGRLETETYLVRLAVHGAELAGAVRRLARPARRLAESNI